MDYLRIGLIAYPLVAVGLVLLTLLPLGIKIVVDLHIAAFKRGISLAFPKIA